MLLKKFLFSAVYVLFITSSILTAQVKFPVGIYSNVIANSPNESARLDSIKSLGPNWIIHESRYTNRAILENNFESMIPMNCYISDTDAIHYYSSGCYSKWEAEENVDSGIIGIKHGCGQQVTVGNDTYWSSLENINDRGKFLVCGPNYYQDKVYKIQERSDIIQYLLMIRMKRGINYLGGSADTLAVLYITNYTTDLVDPIVIHVNQVATDFRVDTFQYNLMNYRPRGIDINNYPSHMSRYNSVDNDNANIQFKIKWFGNYELMVDYIKVMDVGIWGDYLTNNSVVLNKIQQQVSSFSSWAKLKYMYSLDEPGSIDNYIPYKTIQDIVAGYGGKPLITALVPLDTYQNIFHGERSVPRWVNMASPEKLMFDLYPFNVQCFDSTRVDSVSAQFNFLRDVCGAANRYRKNNYYYVGQVHGYSISDKPSAYLRQPSENEFRAASLLALAHGAKGLFYYCYNSSHALYNNNTVDEYVSGLLDANGAKTALYPGVQNFISRMHGKLGDKLLTLNYDDSFLRVVWGISFRQTLKGSDNCSYLRIWKPANSLRPNGIFHCGLLNTSSAESDYTKYFLLLNELSTSTYTQPIMVTAKKTSSSFANYTLKDVENHFNGSFTDSLVQSITIPAGDGYLFYIGLVVKYGGRLALNETVNISPDLTLYSPMTIASGCTLSINKPYYADSLITVEQNGIITLNSGGKIFLGPGSNIVFMGSAGTAAEWQQSLLITRKGGHPNLVWHPYAIGNFVTNRYRIWRKYESADFLLIDSVNGATYKFMDTTIGTYEGELASIPAEYKIIAVTNTYQTSVFSNSVTLAIH